MNSLFSQVGGIPFIISSVTAIVVFIAGIMREKYFKRTTEKHEREMEETKQRFSDIENLLNNVSVSLFTVSHKTVMLRLKYYRNIWNSTLIPESVHELIENL